MYNLYNDYNDGGAGLVAAMLAFSFFFLLIAVVFYVISSIFLMKIFEKAGVEGKWRAWVPVYNTLVFAKLGDISPWVVLIGMGLSLVPYLNILTGIALAVVLALAAWRIGLKLQKDAVWVILYVLLAIVWYGINAFDKSRWNPNIVPAPWAGNGFLADNTVWQGIPVQPRAAAPGYGGAPQGYAPPAQQGYAPPAQPGYAPPAQPGYTPPAQPGYAPPAGPAAPAGPGVPPAAPSAPPAAPPAPPTAPPAPRQDPTQPPS